MQLWVALPDAHRHTAAGFEHVAAVPIVEKPGGLISVFCGGVEHAFTSTPHYSDFVGADLAIHPKHALELPLRTNFEHAVLVLGGDCALEGDRLEPRMLYYLGTTRSSVSFSSQDGARVLLIGGPPFNETILMWWNFVARTPEEIAAAREDWEEHRRFGEVKAHNGPRLAAPDLSRFARANAVS